MRETVKRRKSLCLGIGVSAYRRKITIVIPGKAWRLSGIQDPIKTSVRAWSMSAYMRGSV